MASYDKKVLQGDQLLVYTSKVKEAIGKKQNIIDANNKLSYQYLSGTPTIPTDNKSLTNGAGYQTATQVNSAIETALENQNATTMEAVEAKGYQTADQVQTLINNSGHITEEIINNKGFMTATQVNNAISTATANLQTLKFAIGKPSDINDADLNTIYLVKANSPEIQDPSIRDYYEEWVVVLEDLSSIPGHGIERKWERLGTTDIKLNYITNAEISQIWTDAT